MLDCDDGSGSENADEDPQLDAKPEAEVAGVSTKRKKSFWGDKHQAYVKGLPFCSTVTEIENMFADCGEIKSIKRVLDDKEKWTGSVVVRFSTKEALDLALSLDKTVWMGTGCDGKRFVTIVKHEQKGIKHKRKNRDSQTVFVGNLPPAVTEEEVAALFAPYTAQCGSVTTVRLTMTDEKDPEKRQCRGFAHVSFDYADAQAEALKLNGQLPPLQDDNTPYVRKPTDPAANKEKVAKKKEKNKNKDKGKGKGKVKGKGRGMRKGDGEGSSAGENSSSQGKGKKRSSEEGGQGKGRNGRDKGRGGGKRQRKGD